MRMLLTAAVLAAFLVGCTPSTDLPAQRVRELMDIWETGDGLRLADIATADVVYDDIPNGERFEGLDGAKRYVEHVHSWASLVEIEVVRVQSGSTGALAEWVMRGVQDRPIPGRVPVATNRAFELKGATVIELQDGRIARAADYIDVLGFVVQIGGRVELPGGVVIPPDQNAAQQDDAADAAPPRR